MGFDYLQRAVENISGTSLTQLVEAEVFAPLGMTNSSFGWRDSFAALRAEAYDARGNAGVTFNEKYRTAPESWRSAVMRSYPELNYPNAAAGMYTTAGDYGRFLSALLSPGQVPAWLKQETILEVFQPEIAAGNGVSWGLGWGLFESDNGPAFWHWGNWNGLFQHLAIGISNAGRGVVVLTNSGNGLSLCQRLVPELLGIGLKPIRDFLR